MRQCHYATIEGVIDLVWLWPISQIGEEQVEFERGLEGFQSLRPKIQRFALKFGCQLIQALVINAGEFTAAILICIQHYRPSFEVILGVSTAQHVGA